MDSVSSIVKCFGCGRWVRQVCTESLNTSDGKEVFSCERWCFSCLSVVDESTEEAMKEFTEYPDGLPSWDGEGPDPFNKENDDDEESGD